MKDSSHERVSTGIDGLDAITNGGFFANRSYMLDGPPGAGKSLLGLHFLTANEEDTALCVNLEEPTEAIEINAANVGLSVEDVTFLDFSPDSDVFTGAQSYDIFEPSDVEQEQLIEELVDTIESVEPDRVFIDPVTQFRHVTADQYQFRQQIVGFMRYLADHEATVLFSAQDESASDLDFLCDGTVRITQADGSRLISVPKFRGSATQSGDHVMRIADDGISVYPELHPDEHARAFENERVSSGVPGIDQLLYGGIERGTVTIISGPTGVGKTSLGSQFMKESAGRGERSVIYLFEESKHTFVNRARSINIPVEKMQERGTLEINEVEPVALTPQEFAHDVRREVEEEGADIVMVDGIAGYRLSLLGNEDELLRRVHSLGRYLKRMGVTTIMIDEIDSVTGEFMATDESLSYLADNIVFLRHIEFDGELRKTIGVLKKRMSDFERSLRKFRITENGITVGDPMTGMRNLLSGSPEPHAIEDGE